MAKQSSSASCSYRRWRATRTSRCSGVAHSILGNVRSQNINFFQYVLELLDKEYGDGLCHGVKAYQTTEMGSVTLPVTPCLGACTFDAEGLILMPSLLCRPAGHSLEVLPISAGIYGRSSYVH